MCVDGIFRRHYQGLGVFMISAFIFGIAETSCPYFSYGCRWVGRSISLIFLACGFASPICVQFWTGDLRPNLHGFCRLHTGWPIVFCLHQRFTFKFSRFRRLPIGRPMCKRKNVQINGVVQCKNCKKSDTVENRQKIRATIDWVSIEKSDGWNRTSEHHHHTKPLENFDYEEFLRLQNTNYNRNIPDKSTAK